MSELKEKIDEALGIDVEQIIKDAEQEVNVMDDAQIQKYNERRKEIEELKNSLTTARNMKNLDWSESILKNSTDKLVISQAIFAQEIEDDPCSKNLTAMGELSNALANTVGAVLEIERGERKLKISQEKNDLRAKELEITSGGIIDTNKDGNFLGQGTGQDIIAMLRDQGVTQGHGGTNEDSKEDE